MHTPSAAATPTPSGPSGASPTAAARQPKQPHQQPRRSLADESRTTIPTAEAAFHLSRAPHTLCKWACHKNGPIQPRKIHGRLAWSVAEIRELVGAAQ